MADNRIGKLIAQVARELLDEKSRVTVEEIVEETRDRHSDIISENAELLIENSMRAAARRVLKSLAEDEDEPEQLTLHGLTLPTVIVVRAEEDTYYVDARAATWDEVIAGERERMDNVAAAREKLRLYQQAQNILQPYMEGHPRRTVEAAYKLARKDGKL